MNMSKNLKQSKDLSFIQLRRDLYPGLYKSDEEAQEAIEKYAVFDGADYRKRPRLDFSLTPGESVTAEVIADSSPVKEETADLGEAGDAQKPIYSNADIWGAIPNKEPKHLVECQVCARQVAVSRFAPHLDKCMGLGTVRGTGANGATRGNSFNR